MEIKSSDPKLQKALNAFTDLTPDQMSEFYKKISTALSGEVTACMNMMVPEEYQAFDPLKVAVVGLKLKMKQATETKKSHPADGIIDLLKISRGMTIPEFSVVLIGITGSVMEYWCHELGLVTGEKPEDQEMMIRFYRAVIIARTIRAKAHVKQIEKGKEDG